MRALLCKGGIASAISGLSLQAMAAVTLLAYNVDAEKVSVSGLSSGGFMALQLHVAYSATFQAGAGIVAGGPFYCAQGSLDIAVGPCMAATVKVRPATAALIALTDAWAGKRWIDPVGNLRNSRVYLYSGLRDSVVRQKVVDEVRNYYRHYLPSANIFYKNDIASEHAMITDFFGSACRFKGKAYINNCHFDLAGDMLKWIYGPLNSKNSGTLSGTFVEFKQTEFIADAAVHGMADTGWLFVPANCGSKRLCKLHVVLHGCGQSVANVSDKYYRNTGYNQWADSNDLIVLYPQVAGSSPGNPNGCWDWWGYDDANYAKKSGRQMAAIKGMVDRIIGSKASGPD